MGIQQRRKSRHANQNKSRQKIGVLVSGGLDSTALVAHYLREGVKVYPVYIRCGLRWEKDELNAAKKFLGSISSLWLQPIKILSLSLENAYQNNWSKKGKTPTLSSPDSAVFLPARNLLLLTKAILFLSSIGVYQLAIGTLKGNPFEDGKIHYFKLLEKILSGGFEKKIKLHIPFRLLRKKEVIKKNRAYSLYLSLSCINPKHGIHCGKCNKCAERKKAFGEAGVEDKTIYR